MKRILLPLLASLLACDSGGPPGPDWGVEYEFKVRPPEDAERARGGVPGGLRRIERRLSLAGFPHARATLDGDVVRLRVPGVDASTLVPAARAIAGGGGMLRIHLVAEADKQAAFQATRSVPARHRAIENRELFPAAKGAVGAPILLLKSDELLTGREIRDAWVEPEPGGGWRVIFEIPKEEARRLEDAVGPKLPVALAIVSLGKLVRIFEATAPIERGVPVPGLGSEEEARDVAGLLLDEGYNPVWKSDGGFGGRSQGSWSFKYYGRAPAPP